MEVDVIKRLDVIVLGLLTARPRTGYDVRKWLDTYGRVMGYTAPAYRSTASWPGWKSAAGPRACWIHAPPDPTPSCTA